MFASGGVKGREEVEAAQGGCVQCSIDSLEVVADIFAQGDGLVPFVLLNEQNFAKATTNPDDCMYTPTLRLTCVPEIAEDTLQSQRLARLNEGGRIWKYL